MSDRDPLELLAFVASCGSLRDPRSGHGTKPTLTRTDLLAALSTMGNPLDGNMALMIGTGATSCRDQIRQHLTSYILAECRRERVIPKLATVQRAVDRAIANGILGTKRGPGGSRYEKWALSELLSRASYGASEMVRRLSGDFA